MRKKTWIIMLAVTLIVGTLGTAMAFATTNQQKLDDVNNQASEAKSELAQLESDIKEKAKEVDAINEKVSAKQAQLDKITNEIKTTKIKMQEREDGLNERLRTMYKNGSIGYIEVILGSSSISEFISNVEMIKHIYKSDQEVMETLKKEKATLEKKEAKLAKEQDQLKDLQAKAEAEASELSSQKSKLEAQIDELNATADAIKAKIAASQNTKKKYTGGAFTWPAPGWYEITSEFGFRLHPVLGVWKGHTGVDIGASSNSTIVAAASGTVILAEWYGGYGYAVVIDHGSGISTLYGHNNSLLVSAGQHVSKGQAISKSGSTGISTGPHLHFEVRINGDYVDPMKYF